MILSTLQATESVSSNTHRLPYIQVLLILIPTGPYEVESVLKQHPGVVESAVVASPDPERVEVVKAFIVLTEEYKRRNQDELRKEIQDFCKKMSAPYKYPRRVQFVEPNFLPKTISGKIMRNRLRAMEKERVGSGVARSKI